MWQQKKFNAFLILILKIKYQPINASSLIIIWFNITKFNGHNHMIFQNHGHSSTYIHENYMEWHKQMPSWHNDYIHEYDK